MSSYLALLGFVAFMVGTPGPANLVVMLAGVQHGVRSCVGFIFGLITGKIFLNIFIGFGLGVVLASYPVAQIFFSYISASYMIWLAFRSWPRAENRRRRGAETSPITYRFRDGVIVHPLNPKAWVMAVLAWSNFAPALGTFAVQLPVVIISFALCQLIFHSLWCWLGAFLGKSFAGNHTLTKAMILLTVLVVMAALLYTPSP
jgi:threonine/homoserine/homoserine lactone efflux protein